MEATSIYQAFRVLRALRMYLGKRKHRACVSMERTFLKRQQLSGDLS